IEALTQHQNYDSSSSIHFSPQCISLTIKKKEEKPVDERQKQIEATSVEKSLHQMLDKETTRKREKEEKSK
ncbi:hypothetical protein TNCT_362201, partial [Trichonephila clavata]